MRKQYFRCRGICPENRRAQKKQKHYTATLFLWHHYDGKNSNGNKFVVVLWILHLYYITCVSKNWEEWSGILTWIFALKPLQPVKIRQKQILTCFSGFLTLYRFFNRPLWISQPSCVENKYKYTEKPFDTTQMWLNSRLCFLKMSFKSSPIHFETDSFYYIFIISRDPLPVAISTAVQESRILQEELDTVTISFY